MIMKKFFQSIRPLLLLITVNLLGMLLIMIHSGGTNEKMALSYIEGLSPLDYTRETDEFLTKKRESIEFLENNLKD